jgi:hypothetical protein
MPRKAVNTDFMTTRQQEMLSGDRAAIYSTKLGRRIYAGDILALPEERHSRAIALHLSIDHTVEFMELCRKALPPESVTQRYDRTRRFPPAMRSMRELMERTEHRKVLEAVLDDFNKLYPDQYYEILEKLYGIRP